MGENSKVKPNALQLQILEQFTGLDVAMLQSLPDDYQAKLTVALDTGAEYQELLQIAEEARAAYLLEQVSGFMGIPVEELQNHEAACTEQLCAAYEFLHDLPDTTDEALRLELTRILANEQGGTSK